ncbi:TRAP transporter substrate-binding protein [Halarcobacter ebronensis]|uniref:ABC transporter substrate-binding protein n=1 Tax=Halarcobacter ebronensis TaxID=1462615 RepID=A0A4Q1APC4_9BACT|nr:TRAP transporter substrate-binding protein DctP [Halarcobacter ebronensis]QKF80681.1 TRAP transporter, substrate binding protein, DctP family [Halarcobacter ebronensis]RXK08478.1 ABC transporter substrate-binding protein [Halarcobacter ebronensis]
MKLFFKLTFIITLLCSFTYAQKVYKLTMATTWTSTQHPLIDTAEHMAKLAEELSNGQIKIRIDASNKHKSPFGVLDMVKGGQYDIAHTASYYWKGKDIAVLPFSSMPFGMTAQELYAWFYNDGGMELAQKVFEKHGVYSFPGGNTGVQMGGWFRKEINTLDDLKGLKMRIPGFAGEVMAKLGVQAVTINPGELYTSLERNTIDALEWVSPSMDFVMGFHKVAPYYYTGWHEPGTEMQFVINRKVFDKLPVHLQNVLKAAMKIAAYDMYINNYDLNALAWERMKKEYPDIKVRTFPKPIMDALKKANAELREEMKASSPEMKEVLDSQEAYQKKLRPWSEMSDYFYLKDNI